MADEVSHYKEEHLPFEISALYLSWRDHSRWPGFVHLMNGSAARICMSKWIRCTSHPSNHNENLYEIGFMHWDDLRICSCFFYILQFSSQATAWRPTSTNHSWMLEKKLLCGWTYYKQTLNITLIQKIRKTVARDFSHHVCFNHLLERIQQCRKTF